jgi:MazG family protein
MTQDFRGHTIEDLRRLVSRLHEPSPAGCPWCLAQTPRTLTDELIKEAYELLDAVERDDADAAAGEIGDLLLVLMAQLQLASMAGRFTLDSVVERLIDKVVGRHPHVFGEAQAATAEDALHVWQAAKQRERNAPASILDGIPRQLPALLRADEMQQRAARVGFDWPDIDGVVAKVHEEIDELASAVSREDEVEELGDLLFALVNYARHRGFSAERSLHQASAKFARRFAAIEADCARRGVLPNDLSLDELDAIWNQVKSEG